MDCLGTTTLNSQKHDVPAKQPSPLEDLRNHSPEQLAELRLLLNSGARLRPDPKRRGLFVAEGHSHVFYILKYPSGSKILVIAVWECEQVSEDADAGNTEKTEIGEQILVCR